MSPAPLTALGRCRSCNAAIYWAETQRGKRMPVDRARVPGGNVRLIWRRFYDEPLAIVLNAAGIALAEAEHLNALENDLTDEPELLLHTAHFATCPNPARHRKPRAAA